MNDYNAVLLIARISELNDKIGKLLEFLENYDVPRIGTGEWYFPTTTLKGLDLMSGTGGQSMTGWIPEPEPYRSGSEW